MDIIDGKTKSLLGHKFRTVKNGLDEAEVLDFLGGLIEQNKKLTLQLEHIDSLMRLAERTVIEAGKEAEIIKKEMIDKAHSQAANIITEGEEKAKTKADDIIANALQKAEEQAQEITRSAEFKAETIKAQANEEAGRIVAEAKQNAAATEQRLQEIIKDAEGEAESIKANADKKAIKVITEATEKAEQLAKETTANAETEARHIVSQARDKAESETRHILNEAKEKAEREALLIKQKSEHLLKKSKKIAEDEIKEKLKKVYEGLLSNLEGIDGDTIMSSIEESGETKIPDHVAGIAAVTQATVMLEESVAEPAPSQTVKATKQEDVNKSSALYDGIVELVVPPPLGLDRMLQFHKHLRNIPNTKVMNLGVSSDKSITIRLELGSPTPLLDILAELPEVEEALETQQEGAEVTGTTHKTADKTPVKRILINTKK